MTIERIKQIFLDFENALARLKASLKEDISISSTILDGTIQRFEFTFELSWKVAKELLNYSGINANTPRMVIKEMYRLEMISSGDGWIDMLEDRNKTSHIYDEIQAKAIYDKIKNKHVILIDELCKKIAEKITELQ